MSIKYNAQPSGLRFHIPKTLAADFDNFLNNDVPNQVGDFIRLHDWYDQFDPDYEEVTVRGELYPDSTKSRYENTDNNMNIRCSVHSDIQKGDIMIGMDGTRYVLDWEVPPEHNNKASRALRCNLNLTVFRHMPEKVDDMGYLIEPEHDEDIVTALPSNAYRYDGRPEWSALAGTPGVVGNNLTLMTVQFNDKTKELKQDDRFIWGNVEYTIIDVNWNGVDEVNSHGTLKISAKKTAGGQQ